MPSIHINVDLTKIDFIFTTPIINKYYNLCGITPFNTVAPSNNRGVYLNINLQSYLKTVIVDTIDPTSRTIISKDSDGVVK